MSRLLTRLLPLALGAVLAVPLLAAPSHAATPVTAVPCSAPESAVAATSATTSRASSRVPSWRSRGSDTPVVGADDLAALRPVETSRRVLRAEVEPVLPDVVTIPVHAHVITGTHRGERTALSAARVAQVVATLNEGYAGAQSADGSSTRYAFTLASSNTRRSDAWFHAAPGSLRDEKMRRALHRGRSASLNLYFTGGGRPGQQLLGWARFPWQYAARPAQDGVTINVDSLPGGRADGYNLGDTVIHEVGHWLGLLHPFQGGCKGGDLVSDTPAEAEPSYECEIGRDTCKARGLDPVTNFMDYSYDSCMDQFTPGQVARMDAAFLEYRYVAP